MNYLGIDYGEKRIGLSCGDSDVRLAVPIAAAVQTTFAARMEQIAEVIRQRRIGELVVGYPYNMDGSIGFKAKEVDVFIEKLEAQLGLPVHRTDERLTSSDAQARMNEAGRGSRSRGKQSIRAKLAERKSGALDSRAATLILQDYLDALPGTLNVFGDDDIASDPYEDAPDPYDIGPDPYQAQSAGSMATGSEAAGGDDPDNDDSTGGETNDDFDSGEPFDDGSGRGRGSSRRGRGRRR